MSSFVFLTVGLMVGALVASLLASARAAAMRQRNLELQQQSTAACDALERLGVENRSLVEARASLAARLEAEQRSASEKQRMLMDASEQLKSQFKALAATALESNNSNFLELARTTLAKYQSEAAGELAKREKAVEVLVKPIAESLKQVDEQVRELEKSRAEAYGSLSAQVTSLLDGQRALQAETGNLVRAMREPQARGRWGELQLRRVVELAGMLDNCDFEEQHTFTNDERRFRPDVIVRLPGGKRLVVDSKVPLTSYLAAVEAPDDATRKTRFVDHARQVRAHVDSLAAKSYWAQLPCTPEFVVLFLPGEVFFRAAMDADPELIEYGVEQKVILASPTTLIALLKAVAYGWNQKNLAESARHISDAGKQLYERLCKMTGYMEDVGKKLGGAVKSYNEMLGSMERRVFPAARRLSEMDRSLSSELLTEVQQLEQTPRELEAADWQERPSELGLPFTEEQEMKAARAKM